MVLPADVACNPKHGQTDASKAGSAGILEAAAVAVAAINTAAAIQMANLQWQIAKMYLDIAQAWRDYYNNTYKPWEDQELAEAWALTPFDMAVDIAVGRARTVARLAFAGKADAASRCVSPYCTGLRGAMLKDVLSAEGAALAALAGLGERNERALKDARDDVRWKKREQVVNRGRSMMAENISFATLAAGIFGDLGRQAGEGAGGAISWLGYNRNRRPTAYPETLYQYDVPGAGNAARYAAGVAGGMDVRAVGGMGDRA